MVHEWECNSEADLPRVANEILKEISNYPILLLEGEMGVGKTTFSKVLVAALGSNDKVSSPTFSIVNEYHTKDGGKIFHFDFYRLKDESEVENIGIDEYFYSGYRCILEWPNKIPHYIPSKHAKIELILGNGNQRIFRLNFYDG